MSTVTEDLRRLEDRILARIGELEANVAAVVSDGSLYKDGRGLWRTSH